MESPFNVHPKRYIVTVKKKEASRSGSGREALEDGPEQKGAGKMGDILVIVALALYVPMSMVYVLAGKG